MNVVDEPSGLPRYLTAAEVGEILRCSPSTVRRLVGLKGTRRGRATLYDPAEVRRWIKANEFTPTEPEGPQPEATRKGKPMPRPAPVPTEGRRFTRSGRKKER